MNPTSNGWSSPAPTTKGCLPRDPTIRSGLAVSLVDVNPRITERINSILSKTTGGQASASEISYEVYYGIAVAPGMTLKPFFGFMSHPDQVNNPTPSGNITHAVYLGVLFEVDMAHLFGLPTLSR